MPRLALLVALLVIPDAALRAGDNPDAALRAGDAPDAPASPAAPTPPPTLGKWLLTADGAAVGPDDFRRGLQPSGLVWHAGELLSVGDQRSQYPGHLFRIDPATGRLLAPPVRIELPEASPGEPAAFAAYRAVPNPDYEGLTVDPRHPDRLYAVTEDKTPWIVAIRRSLTEDDHAAPRVEALVPLELPDGVAAWRDDTNFRLEGLTIDDEGRTLYLAFERSTDDLPRLLRVDLSAVREAKGAVRPALVPVDFASVPRRADKGPARLNLNGIQFVRRTGRAWIVGVARDQERVLLIDPEAGRVVSLLDLDLRDADGQSIVWVSPEGVTVDSGGDPGGDPADGAEHGRIWLVNDPDSVRGNYRRRDTEAADGAYADYVPLLFTVPLARLFEGVDESK